ncbi:hypothetical protein [Mycobacterium sp. NPDC006124]|uniref:hypothetical protein n=1 Tax=Mycobacterium sp. NPDC006124 TaxID=3156729 RepID=UPI0033B04F59
MAGLHRSRSRRRFSVALVSAATATATALTVGVEPPPAPVKRFAAENVDLTASTSLLPTHDKVPDITGGLGTAVYDFNQAFFDSVSRAVVNGISFAALAQAAGVDPQSLITTLLADIPANLLPGILATLAQSVPVLGPALDGLNLDVLADILDRLGIDEVTDATLTGLLALIGYNLQDPLNLGGLAVPGLNVITTGPAFATLKVLGLDLGWVPGLPNSVANEINGSEYLEVGAKGLLDLVLAKVNQAAGGPILGGILSSLGVSLGDVLTQLTGIIGQITNPVGAIVPDLIHVRITPTVGVGLGAFAAAMAYQEVINDLPNQPGGTNYPAATGTPNPLLGSLTLLPLVLINNPARPDGGAAARFGALAALFGINTVNPRTQLTGQGGITTLPLGLRVGGANVLPVLVDATYEYQPLSDLASWPNAFSLFNNLAAGLSPTYMLRGLDLTGLETDLAPQLAGVVKSVADGNPLALNLYLTLHSSTLPLLEPLYLASDFLNLVGLSPLAQIPMRIANALAPALRILTDVGYADVVRNADGTYTRIPNSSQETPFLSFPNLDPGLVLSDTFNALVGGIQKELGPNPTPSTPNVLKTLLDALLGDGLGGILPGGATGTQSGSGTGAVNPFDAIAGLLNNALGGLLGGLNLGGLVNPLAAPTTTAALSKTAAGELPSASARLLSIAPTDDTSKEIAPQSDSKAGGTQAEGVGAAGDATPAADGMPPTSDGRAPESDETPATGEKTDAGEKTEADQKDADQKGADQKGAAANEDPAPAAGPKRAKPEGNSTSSSGTASGTTTDTQTGTVTGKTNGPKHAKPEQGVVRESPNFSPTTTSGGGSTTGDGKKTADTPAAADPAPAGADATAGAAAA